MTRVPILNRERVNSRLFSVLDFVANRAMLVSSRERSVPAHRFPAIHFFSLSPPPPSPPTAFLLNGNGELRLRFMAALYLGGCEISVLWPTGLSLPHGNGLRSAPSVPSRHRITIPERDVNHPRAHRETRPSHGILPFLFLFFRLLLSLSLLFFRPRR